MPRRGGRETGEEGPARPRPRLCQRRDLPTAGLLMWRQWGGLDTGPRLLHSLPAAPMWGFPEARPEPGTVTAPWEASRSQGAGGRQPCGEAPSPGRAFHRGARPASGGEGFSNCDTEAGKCLQPPPCRPATRPCCLGNKPSPSLCKRLLATLQGAGRRVQMAPRPARMELTPHHLLGPQDASVLGGVRARECPACPERGLGPLSARQGVWPALCTFHHGKGPL